jgi:hypothetical protein
MKFKPLGLALCFLLAFSSILSAQAPKIVLKLHYSSDYDLYGYADSATGKLVIPLQYDFAQEFYEGLAAVTKDNKSGFINTQGKVVVPLIYEDARYFSEGMAFVVLNGNTGFVNKTGALVIPAKYSSAGPFSDGLSAVVLENGKCGYINKTGTMVIEAKFDHAKEFYKGYAIAIIGRKSVVIDKMGKTVPLPEGLNPVGVCGPGIFIVNTPLDKYGMADRTGKLVLDTIYDYLPAWQTYSTTKYLPVRKDGLNGWVDMKGTVIFPPQFTKTISLENDSLRGVARFDAELATEKWYVVNLRSRKVITARGYDKIHPFNNGMAMVEMDGSIGYVDLKGNEKIAPIYQAGTDFKDGLGIVVQDGRMMLINKNNVIVSDTFDFIIHLENELYAVNNGGRSNQENGIDGGLYGLLDRNGKSITAVKFDYLEEFVEGSGAARTMTGEVIGIVRPDGSERSFPDYIYISEFEEGMAAFYEGGYRDTEGNLRGGKFGFMNEKGDIVIPARFDNGNYFSDGLSLVYVGDSTFFIDKTGKKVLDMSQWDQLGSGFHDGRMVVKSKQGMVGFIDKTGKVVIPCIYSDASAFNDGCAMVQTWEGSILIIDKAGKVLKTKSSSGYY